MLYKSIVRCITVNRWFAFSSLNSQVKKENDLTEKNLGDNISDSNRSVYTECEYLHYNTWTMAVYAHLPKFSVYTYFSFSFLSLSPFSPSLSLSLSLTHTLVHCLCSRRRPYRMSIFRWFHDFVHVFLHEILWKDKTHINGKGVFSSYLFVFFLLVS